MPQFLFVDLRPCCRKTDHQHHVVAMSLSARGPGARLDTGKLRYNRSACQSWTNILLLVFALFFWQSPRGSEADNLIFSKTSVLFFPLKLLSLPERLTALLAYSVPPPNFGPNSLKVLKAFKAFKGHCSAAQCSSRLLERVLWVRRVCVPPPTEG